MEYNHGNTKQTRAFDGAPPTSDGVGTEEHRRDNETTYWGILCRKCLDPVAFDVCPYPSFGPGAANVKPSAIRCGQGHNHIYFPRDFRFLPSAVPIADSVMQQNRDAYRAINPAPALPRHAEGGLSHARPHQPSDIPPNKPDIAETRHPIPAPDSRRETAQMAAKQIWARWALKKKAV
jgi:hypothetical protein